MKAAHEVLIRPPVQASAPQGALTRRLHAAFGHRVDLVACALTARGRFVPRVSVAPDESGSRFEASFACAVTAAPDWAEIEAIAEGFAAQDSEGLSPESARAGVLSAIDFWIDNFVIDTLALAAVESRRVARHESWAPPGARRVIRPIGKELRFLFALLGEDRDLHVQSQEEQQWALTLCAWSEALVSIGEAPALALPCPPGWNRRETLRAWLLPTYEAVCAAASERLWDCGRGVFV